MRTKKSSNSAGFSAPATTPLPSGGGNGEASNPQRNRAGGPPPGNTNARKHGVHSLKRTVRELGSRTVDRRTTVGRALAAWRAELVDDYGGEDALSTAELALIDEAVVSKLLLGSVNAWLLERGDRLVNKRRGALVQAVRDRSALVRELRETLTTLGTKRRQAPPDPLAVVLAAYAGKRAVLPQVERSEAMGTPRLAARGGSVARKSHRNSENASAGDGQSPDPPESPTGGADHGASAAATEDPGDE